MDKLILLRTSLRSFRRFMCTPASGPKQDHNVAPRYRPSELQKFILVWTKKYKTKDEIPAFVSPDLIERSRSQARIKLSNILILLTILASIAAVVSGKAALKRGESVQQMNLDWHKQYDEDYKKKEAATAAKN